MFTDRFSNDGKAADKYTEFCEMEVVKRIVVPMSETERKRANKRKHNELMLRLFTAHKISSFFQYWTGSFRELLRFEKKHPCCCLCINHFKPKTTPEQIYEAYQKGLKQTHYRSF